ncbi:MAG TPA: alkaline phosphatase D family protein [Steroidobacteraceae bacterium]|nr:alkaline phosphatase D family protein [Steroidobacteraceae bacterium]
MRTRRQFLRDASAIGAVFVIGDSNAHVRYPPWVEKRESFPQGVASGDPAPTSVILWTRRPPGQPDPAAAVALLLQVAADPDFRKIVASDETLLTAQTDYTCRFLVGGLKPATEYWYRFIDGTGAGSRVGRTITAPADHDARPVQFAFVSCQDVGQSACNAYRRMIWEDERRPRAEQLGFVLHLGDFIYEVCWYPEDKPGGRRYSRRIRDLFRYPDGENLHDYHLPVTLEDYRTAYRAYLQDPDLQDARARFPFVPVWDNHEFSWQGFQGIQVFDGKQRPAQTRKVAANQAWWEYQPARVLQPRGVDLKGFTAPAVTNAPITAFDAAGFAREPNNIAAVDSLRIQRSFRYGRNTELILTDNRSYKTADVDLGDFSPDEFPQFSDEDAARILDDGRAYAGGKPPATVHFAGKDLPNPQKDAAPQSYLGIEQRAWLIDKLRASKAPWKVWGHSFGTLAWRSDLQNLPTGLGPSWPGKGYGLINGGFYAEHAEIFGAVRKHGITGLAIVAGDKHSFWAGLACADLPPRDYDPVAVEFVTGSISALGMAEASPYAIKPDHPLRALYLVGTKESFVPSINFTILHGVRAALALAAGDAAKARALRNPDVSPQLSFVDLAGHGYSVVTTTPTALETQFVCIPPPLERSATPDGGPLRYKVTHRTALWKPGERPTLERTRVEGDVEHSI